MRVAVPTRDVLVGHLEPLVTMAGTQDDGVLALVLDASMVRADEGAVADASEFIQQEFVWLVPISLAVGVFWFRLRHPISGRTTMAG